jgi:hypothetical protein
MLSGLRRASTQNIVLMQLPPATLTAACSLAPLQASQQIYRCPRHCCARAGSGQRGPGNQTAEVGLGNWRETSIKHGIRNCMSQKHGQLDSAPLGRLR